MGLWSDKALVLYSARPGNLPWRASRPSICAFQSWRFSHCAWKESAGFEMTNELVLWKGGRCAACLLFSNPWQSLWNMDRKKNLGKKCTSWLLVRSSGLPQQPPSRFVLLSCSCPRVCAPPMAETWQITSAGEEEKSSMSWGRTWNMLMWTGGRRPWVHWGECSLGGRQWGGERARGQALGWNWEEAEQGRGFGNKARAWREARAKEGGRQSRGLKAATKFPDFMGVSCPRESHPQSSLQPHAPSAPALP